MADEKQGPFYIVKHVRVSDLLLTDVADLRELDEHGRAWVRWGDVHADSREDLIRSSGDHLVPIQVLEDPDDYWSRGPNESSP